MRKNIKKAGSAARAQPRAAENAASAELLNGEIFYSLKEAQIVIEQWRKHYNTVRPHSSLGYRPPAPQTFVPAMLPLDQAGPMQ